MAHIPRDRAPDSTLALMLDGYRFLAKRRTQLRSEIFETRLLLQPTICIRGAEAARLFSDPERFERKGAAPRRLVKTLFGQGGVQGLDGEAHRWRKQMLLALMTPDRISQLVDVTAEQWREVGAAWKAQPTVILFDSVQEVLCRAVCAWAGVPLAEAEVKRRTAEIAAMIDGSGGVGPRHWRARRGRRRAEQWAQEAILGARAYPQAADPSTALAIIASYRDLRGRLLSPHVAAVELLNVVRPTVAVARFITFAALALHDYPEHRQRVAADEGYAELFVQEVRRFYPFFPFAAARTKRAFEWQGYHFPKGRRVLLDLYGTNHDARLWEQPDTFQPDRFRDWNRDAYSLIPQGGGDHYRHHRCPGEWITIELMKLALRLLTRSMTYTVPPQDLRINLTRMPTLPKSRFVIAVHEALCT